MTLKKTQAKLTDQQYSHLYFCATSVQRQIILMQARKYLILMVPGAGIEPARLAAGDFESPASTNFTTRATH